MIQEWDPAQLPIETWDSKTPRAIRRATQQTAMTGRTCRVTLHAVLDHPRYIRSGNLGFVVQRLTE